MATQFYRTLDDILKQKAQNQQQIQEKLAKYESVDTDFNTELARLRTNMSNLGINQATKEELFNGRQVDHSSRLKFIQENNIKHGSPRWFKVMYARPELTGEDPFGE